MNALITVAACLCLSMLQPPAAGEGKSDGNAEGPSTNVVAILDRVESTGDGIDDLSCRVVYTIRDTIADTVTKREGVIRFKRKKPNAVFVIVFDKLVEEGIVKRNKAWYLFDGRWLTEANQRTRSIIQRDIAPPGTEIDLFSISKAPFPIPFGQKKSEVLKHFDVRLQERSEHGSADHDVLVCVPKETSHLADDYSRIEFTVSRELDLPVRITMATLPAGQPDKVITAEFPGLTQESFNRGLADDAFTLPRETQGYAKVRESP